jgi:hypothetical protein
MSPERGSARFPETNMTEVEVTSIERKYESYRLKDKDREQYLLSSIRERGVQEPLVCACGADRRPILLDGFKRLRSCCRLHINRVSIVTVGTDEADSILRLVHQSNARTLNILEQAAFVNALKKTFKLSAAEIAIRLERSHAWVSVRLGIFDEMSDTIRREVFSGNFPIRSYMYTVKQVTRVNKTSPEETDRFVRAVSGKHLSLRQIEALAYVYFRGNPALKKQIEQDDLSWTLRNFRYSENASASAQPGLSVAERRFVRDLELFQKYLQRLIASNYSGGQGPLFDFGMGMNGFPETAIISASNGDRFCLHAVER